MDILTLPLLHLMPELASMMAELYGGTIDDLLDTLPDQDPNVRVICCDLEGRSEFLLQLMLLAHHIETTGQFRNSLQAVRVFSQAALLVELEEVRQWREAHPKDTFAVTRDGQLVAVSMPQG